MKSRDPDLRARIDAWESSALDPADFEARARTPMSPFEREDFRALVTWFGRRYPTAGERMRYVRLRMKALRQRTA